ncbi:MAG TPA: hypothetical protein VIX86_04125 [Streptosporangiaceae bacterium]
MADRAGWRDTLESELRAVGRELAVPPASDLTATVRQRLETGATRHRRLAVLGAGSLRPWRLGWRAALVAVVAILAVLIATPQGRAAIIGVFRFAGVEFRQGTGPVRSPGHGGSLPGQRRMSLAGARHRVSFPILVPAALGRPSEVSVSDGGRVVSLIYRRTRYGQVRMDEYAGHLYLPVFEKFLHFAHVTVVKVNGAPGLWIRGPQELVYITRAGVPVAASARLTTGNTLIWGTSQVALRLEGDLSQAAAVAIADSAR